MLLNSYTGEIIYKSQSERQFMDFVEVKKESQVLKYLFSQFFLGLSCALSKDLPCFGQAKCLQGDVGVPSLGTPSSGSEVFGFLSSLHALWDTFWICPLSNAQVNSAQSRIPKLPAAPCLLHPLLRAVFVLMASILYFPLVISQRNKMEFLWHRVFSTDLPTFHILLPCHRGNIGALLLLGLQGSELLNLLQLRAGCGVSVLKYKVFISNN